MLAYSRAPEIPDRHNIDELIKCIPQDPICPWTVGARYRQVGNLTAMAVKARYAVLGEDVAQTDALKACNLAVGIFRTCMNDLVAHGLQLQGLDIPSVLWQPQ